MDSIVVWFGTFAVLMKLIWKKMVRVEKCEYSIEENNKRIGVYYMCIDDLLI